MTLDFETEKQKLLECIKAMPATTSVIVYYKNNQEFKLTCELAQDPEIIETCHERQVNLLLKPHETLGLDEIDYKFMSQVHTYAIYTAALELASRSEFSTDKWLKMLLTHSVRTLSDCENVSEFIAPIVAIWPDDLPDEDELVKLRDREPQFVKTPPEKIQESIEAIKPKFAPVFEELKKTDSDGYFLDAKDCFIIIPLLILALKHPDLKDEPNPHAREIIAEMKSYINGILPSAPKLWEEFKK